MSDSVIVLVAGAVVTELNAAPPGTFVLPFTAIRYYRPEFDLKELAGLRVSVVPRKIEITGLGRQSNQYDVSVDVAVQKKVELSKTADLDKLMLLAEQIAEFFRLRRIEMAGGGSALWAKTDNDPIYAPEHLETKQVFTSVLTLTFRVAR